MEFIKYICPLILFASSVLAYFLTILILWSPERKETENKLLAALCLGSGIWSMGFGALFLQTDPEIAYHCRAIGMIGTMLYLIIALILTCFLSKLPRNLSRFFYILASAGFFIYFLTVERSQTIYKLDTLGMTYSFKPGPANTIYTIYSVLVALSILGISIYMCFSPLKRIRHFGKLILLMDAIVLFGTILDTVLPLMGMAAIPGSTITQFWGMVVAFVAIRADKRSKINITNMSEFIYYSLSIPVLVYDSKYTLKLANDAAAKFFGIRQDTLSQAALTPETLFRTDADTLFGFTSNSHSIDTTCLSNDIYCNLSVNKIIDRYDDVIGYIVIVSDLSERMKNMQRLEEARKDAEAANRAKTAFLANMSHEIRTPMNAIMGFSELILKMDISGPVYEYVSDIRNSSRNLLAIINDILDISKLDSGKTELFCTEYQTRNLLQDVYLIIDVQAQKKGLLFQMTADPRIPSELYGDATRIRSILVNILNNAIKYTREGSVHFNIRLLDVQGEMATLEYSIIDTGIGIKESALEHLFDSFSRFDSKKNSDIEGTGLGLSIVNGYVKLMDGSIKVDSIYGVGSTFTVTIPQKIVNSAPMSTQPVAPASEPVTTQENIRIHDTHVLVTDDNPVNLKVIKSTLEMFGFTVDTAASGEEAVTRCETTQYDMIFMDQMMPHMDGTEAMLRIREVSPLYNHGGPCKIIALTANALTGVREELLAKGFDEYLSKPIDWDMLEKLIKFFIPADKLSIREVRTQATVSLTVLEPEIDLSDAMTHCGGKQDLFLHVLKIAHHSAPKQIRELQKYTDDKDYTNLTIHAHSLKGQLLNMGAKELGDMARNIEYAAKENPGTDISEMVYQFVDTYEHLLAKIEQLL